MLSICKIICSEDHSNCYNNQPCYWKWYKHNSHVVFVFPNLHTTCTSKCFFLQCWKWYSLLKLNWRILLNLKLRAQGRLSLILCEGEIACMPFSSVLETIHSVITVTMVGNWSPKSELLKPQKDVKLRTEDCPLLNCTILLVKEMKLLNSIPIQNDGRMKLIGEQVETAVFYCNTDSGHILLLIYNENGNCKGQAEGSL